MHESSLQDQFTIAALPIRLEALESHIDMDKREEVYRKAAERFAEIMKRPIPQQGDIGLGKKEFDRVLLIHMAAYAAVCGHPLQDENELLDFVVGRKKTRIQKVMKDRSLDPRLYNNVARH